MNRPSGIWDSTWAATPSEQAQSPCSCGHAWTDHVTSTGCWAKGSGARCGCDKSPPCVCKLPRLSCPNCAEVCHACACARDIARDAAEQARRRADVIAATDDPVTSPAHYKTDAGMEAVDVMEAFNLGLHLGNAVKYILRAGKKDDYAQDLRKAIWWLQREVDRQ